MFLPVRVINNLIGVFLEVLLFLVRSAGLRKTHSIFSFELYVDN